MNARVFWIFGLLQSASLGAIILLVLRSLSALSEKGIGLDTTIVLSIVFPLFLLLVEYTIFAKR